jgi:hypothetical protein
MINFAELSLSKLADAYNAGKLILGEATIKKFADKATAVTRVERMAAELTERFGVVAVLTDDLSWTPAVDAEAEVETTEAEVETTSADEVKKGRGRELQLDMDLIIEPIAINPKNKGSRAHAIFSLYRSGMTVAEFVDAVVAAGYTRKLASSAIRWDSERNYITLLNPSKD